MAEMTSSPQTTSFRKSTEERRLLVHALLEIFEKQGGRVIHPVAENEDSSMDRLHIPQLIEAIRTSKYLDMGKLMNGDHGTDGVDPGMENESAIPLTLNIPQLQISLDEHELQGLAFMLFSLYCIDDSNQLATSMRRQLELSASCAADMMKVAQRIRALPEISSTYSTEIGIELVLKLIKEVRPSDFQKLRDFVNWRDAVARVLVQVLKESVTTRSTKSKAAKKPDQIPLLIANLKGGVRRLCFQEEDEFEEREYADAIVSVTTIAQKMRPYSESGFTFMWGLRIRLWETLLVGLFEIYEDDIYIDDADVIKAMMLQCLAPRLQISTALHDACFAWMHFKELMRSLLPALFPIVKSLLTTVHSNDPALEELDRAYVSEILEACYDALTEMLMDYHTRVPDSTIMAGTVDLFLSMTESATALNLSPLKLEDCITTSCTKAFQRMQEKQKEESNPNVQLKKLAQQTMELYETELLKYTGPLAPHCPSAASVAAKALHDSFGQELKPVLYELKSIPEDVVQMLKSADELEVILMKEIHHDRDVAKSTVPWNVMDAISELLFSWVDAQLHKIKEWRERLVQEETWQPQSTSMPLSASALEFKRLLEESILLVFSLNLNFPESLVDKFVTGLASALEAYAKTTMSDIRGEKGTGLLVPPVPDLTRYKKDLADSAAVKEERSLQPKPNKRHSRLKSILVDSSVTKMVPLIEDSENYQWFNNLKVHTLIVRINSLHFLKESIPELSEMIERNSCSRGVQRRADEETSAAPLRIAGATLEKSVDVFCTFLGTKIVFWDGRLPWLEQLYRHHVSSSRMDFILQDLHKSLMDINSVALGSIRNKIVHALLQACVRCLRRVLLQGGQYRLFRSGATGNDRELIEEDLKKLKDLFNDEEEGLPMSLIEETTKPVLEILLQMSLSTSNLIQLAEDARKNNSRDLSVYTQILGHRADRMASKWLKKVMKTPKKIKTKL